MVSPPELHADIYPAVDLANFKDTQKGNVVLVIGSARGIGQAICLSFAKAGGTIAAFDFRDASETVELAKKEGVSAKCWQLDATDEKAVKTAIDEVEKDLGPIKVLLNVAGITGSRPIMMEYYDNFRKTMDTNCGATMISILNVLPRMRDRKSGVIINIASRSGSKDFPSGLAYAVSKCAVIRLTGCIQMALDAEGLGEDIQIYCLHPGGVLTDMPQTPVDPDVVKAYPNILKARQAWLPNFKTSRFLCGATAVYIASGKAKLLKGRYFDCEQDIEHVLREGKEEIVEKDLYRMKIDFLGGLPNDGGIAKDLKL